MNTASIITALGWCAIFNIILLSVWFFVFILAKEQLFRLHSCWFKLPRESFETILYVAMAFYKILIWAFFIIPYLVLRFML